MFIITKYFFNFILIFGFINVSVTQYDKYFIYGSNYPYPPSASINDNGINLFTGITGDFLSSMTSALLSGVGNGVTETFLPGSTSLSSVYPQQIGPSNFYTNNYYPNKIYPYSSNYINNLNNLENNEIKLDNYENLYNKGSLVETQYTLPNIHTINSQYYPSSFNGIDGPKPLGTTFGGFSNAWGRPIIPVISSKDTTAFNGKFLAALISKMGYQKGTEMSTTTPLPSMIDQTLEASKMSSTIPTDTEVTKTNNLKRRKRNIINKKLHI
uniref:Uncharacterized protein n=1 Tax=Strongyloides stercoralis TaxID=6248 RepID=A0A0K0E9H7_STRER